MSKFLLDTNAVISLLKGNYQVNDLIINAEWVGISIISKLEYLSFPNLTKEDQELFYIFENRIEVIDLANAQRNLLDAVVQFRNENKVKLPDAIIAASAFVNRARLLTADRRLLDLWPKLALSIG